METSFGWVSLTPKALACARAQISDEIAQPNLEDLFEIFDKSDPALLATHWSLLLVLGLFQQQTDPGPRA